MIKLIDLTMKNTHVKKGNYYNAKKYLFFFKKMQKKYL